MSVPGYPIIDLISAPTVPCNMAWGRSLKSVNILDGRLAIECAFDFVRGYLDLVVTTLNLYQNCLQF